MYLVTAIDREGGFPCTFEKLETENRREAFTKAREWWHKGKIVRVFERNGFGLYATVPQEQWLKYEIDQEDDGYPD